MIDFTKARIFIHRNRLALGIAGGILLVAIIASTTAAYFHHRDKEVACSGNVCQDITPLPSGSTDSPAATPTPTATPLLVAARLNGTLVPTGSEALRPLAVMIENHPDARPQSGLGSADLVYEAIAEGGITRFMAVFGDARNAVKVGPIRSARTYYVDFATELGAFYAHVGGNMDALDQIKTTNVLDLDQFAVGEPTYKREFTRNVALEHTMYSSTEKLWNYATQTKGWSSTAEYEGWKFADDATAENRPESQKVIVNFSSAQFNVTWNYDKATNTYSRVMGGKAHVDANTDQTITTKNIILETVKNTPTVTRINEHGWIYTLTGTGSGVVIHDGKATPVTWKKTGTGRTKYYTSDGNEVTLTRGTTWVEVIHSDTQTSY